MPPIVPSVPSQLGSLLPVDAVHQGVERLVVREELSEGGEGRPASVQQDAQQVVELERVVPSGLTSRGEAFTGDRPTLPGVEERHVASGIDCEPGGVHRVGGRMIVHAPPYVRTRSSIVRPSPSKAGSRCSTAQATVPTPYSATSTSSRRASSASSPRPYPS